MAIAKRLHPFPSRTRKLSSLAPMVLLGKLSGRVGRRRLFLSPELTLCRLRAFFVSGGAFYGYFKYFQLLETIQVFIVPTCLGQIQYSGYKIQGQGLGISGLENLG